MKTRCLILSAVIVASLLATAAFAASAGRWSGAMIVGVKTMSSEAVSPDIPNVVVITLNEAPDAGFGSACGAAHNTEVVLNLAATNNSGSVATLSNLMMALSTRAFITVYGTNTCNIISGYETVDAVML
jgi:hypothetical protein